MNDNNKYYKLTLLPKDHPYLNNQLIINGVLKEFESRWFLVVGGQTIQMFSDIEQSLLGNIELVEKMSKIDWYHLWILIKDNKGYIVNFNKELIDSSSSRPLNIQITYFDGFKQNIFRTSYGMAGCIDPFELNRVLKHPE